MKTQWRALALPFVAVTALLASWPSIAGPTPDRSGKVITVLGPVDPQTLGDTLMHEHLFSNGTLPLNQPERWQVNGNKPPVTAEEIAHWEEPFTIKNRTKLLGSSSKNRDAYTLDSTEDAASEIRAYQQLGGKSLVDVTPMGIRTAGQAGKLRELAKRTGAHIVMGTGFYRPAWYPADMDQRTVPNLTAEMMRELVEGVDGTDIKAGIIGEITVEDIVLAPRDSNTVKVLRAAAHASRLTGAAISLHCNCFLGAMDDVHTGLDILQSEGADLSRVVVGHAINMDLESGEDMDLFEGILRRGVYLQFDLLGMPHFELYQGQMLIAIKKLIMRGYAKQLLVSHDTWYKMQLTTYGGYGYTYIHSKVIPFLKDKGIGQPAIRDILENNPRRVLTLAKPQPLQRQTSARAAHWMPTGDLSAAWDKRTDIALDR